MCRAKSESGRRCGCPSSGAERSAADRAQYAIRKHRSDQQPFDVVAPEPDTTPPASITADSRPEDLRRLGALIGEAYTGTATPVLEQIYGSPLAALRALGAAVAGRAERIAGLTADQVESRWRERLDVNPTNFGVNAGIDAETIADVRRLAGGCVAALAEIRPMGGDLDAHMPEQYDHTVWTALHDVARAFPADWATASADNERPLHLGVTDRAFYRHEEGYVAEMHEEVPGETEFVQGAVRPYGDHWMRADDGWIRGARRVVGASRGDLPVSLLMVSNPRKNPPRRTAADLTHELSHRMEFVVPGIKAMEADFLRSRSRRPDGTTAEPTWLGAPYAAHETAVEGDFTDRYIGKTYANGSHEILSVGWEALQYGEFGGLVGAASGHHRDDDMRHFVLGMLAAAGHR